MFETKAELARQRRARLWSTLERLEDASLREHVERTSAEPLETIDEWHDFVEGLDRVARGARRYEEGRIEQVRSRLAS